MSKLLLYSFFFLTSVNSILASQVYNLSDCIKVAIENNYDIKILKINIQSTRIEHNQAKYNLLPNINIGSGVNYNIGYSINPLDFTFTNENSFSGNLTISSQVTLFQGFQQLKAIEKAKIDHLAATFQIKSLENNVKIQVIHLYLQTILEFETLKVLRNQVEISKSLLKKKKEATDNGLIAKSSYRDQQLQITIDQANQSHQELRVENALKRLKMYLLFPIDENFNIDTSNFNISVFNSKNIVNIELKNFQSMPDVQLEQMRLLSAQKQIQFNNGAFYPTVTLGYLFGSNFINTAKTFDYRTITNPAIGFTDDSSRTIVRSFSNESITIAENEIPIFSQLGNNKQHQIQLNLQWQIFGKGLKRTNMKLAKLFSKQQEYRLKLTEQKMKENYYQALSNVQSAYNKYKTSIAVYEAQKERYYSSKEKFEYNIIDFFEFINYQKQFQNSEIELSKSKIEWFFNREIVKLYDF